MAGVVLCMTKTVPDRFSGVLTIADGVGSGRERNGHVNFEITGRNFVDSSGKELCSLSSIDQSSHQKKEQNAPRGHLKIDTNYHYRENSSSYI